MQWLGSMMILNPVLNQSTYWLLQYLLGEINYFEVSIGLLKLLNLQFVSLSEPKWEVHKWSDAITRQLLEPCNGSFPESSKKDYVEMRIVLRIERQDLVVILNMYHMICSFWIELEAQNRKLIRSWSHLNRLRKTRSVHVLDGFFEHERFSEACV